MPEISRFEGIIITMHFNDHNPPHFHAEYNESDILIDINSGIIIKGALPKKQSRLVLAWYELHKEELLELWNSKKLIKIQPLK